MRPAYLTEITDRALHRRAYPPICNFGLENVISELPGFQSISVEQDSSLPIPLWRCRVRRGVHYTNGVDGLGETKDEAMKDFIVRHYDEFRNLTRPGEPRARLREAVQRWQEALCLNVKCPPDVARDLVDAAKDVLAEIGWGLPPEAESH